MAYVILKGLDDPTNVAMDFPVPDVFNNAKLERTCLKFYFVYSSDFSCACKIPDQRSIDIKRNI